jgi:hypothetical protein
MSKDDPPFPLGPITIPVGRAFFAKTKDGGRRGTMLLSMLNGDAKTDDGAKVTFSAAGTVLRIQFEYPGDSGDDRFQQDYEVDFGDIADKLHKLNKLRRADKFADAPPAEEA